jgi:hypothetical protein
MDNFTIKVKSLHPGAVNHNPVKIIKVKFRVTFSLIRNQKLGILKLEIYASNIQRK